MPTHSRRPQGPCAPQPQHLRCYLEDQAVGWLPHKAQVTHQLEGRGVRGLADQTELLLRFSANASRGIRNPN